MTSSLLNKIIICLALMATVSAFAVELKTPLTPEKVKVILTELSTLLNTHYVHKDKARQYANSLATLPESHPLFSISDSDIFKVAISEYLQTIHKDGHLRVYDPETTERLLQNSNFDEEHNAEGDAREQFLKIEQQTKRFIHLSVSSLPYGETYEQEAIELLATLPRTEMLILDLRDNSGGSARTVRAILNCILPEVTPLYSLVVSSGKDKGEHVHASVPVADCHQVSLTPMTVLVSSLTASAAELLAMLLKNRGRAVVIGENTYGAGNPVELFMLPYEHSVYIPISTIVDSITGEGFELTGVQPDITVDFLANPDS